MLDLQKYNSVNAKNQSDNTSGKYKFIPTTEVIKVLGDQGWLPTQAKEVNTKKHMGFQKHMLRFRHVDSVNQ